jgi:hypothetical protein
MDYVLERTIVLVSQVGRIKTVVYSIVIIQIIVHFQKETVLVQINAIVVKNGLEIIAILLFAILSVL